MLLDLCLAFCEEYVSKVKKIPVINKYLPDYEDDVLPDCDYFMRVVSTVMGDWLFAKISVA